MDVSQEGDGTIAVRFEAIVRDVGPGDRIVVRVANVTNTEIAVRDPQGVRSFALRVTTSGLRGNSEGPVEVRYEIDPNATTQATDAAAPNATGENATADANGTAAEGNASGANATDVNGTGDGAATDANNATDTAVVPAGGSGSTSGSALTVAASSPTLVGVGAIGGVAVAVLAVSAVVYGRRKRRSKGRNGPSGGRERL